MGNIEASLINGPDIATAKIDRVKVVKQGKRTRLTIEIEGYYQNLGQLGKEGSLITVITGPLGLIDVEQFQRVEELRMKAALTALAQSAGGRITISRDEFMAGMESDLIEVLDPEHPGIIYAAKKKEG